MIPLVIMDKTFVNADPLSPTYIGLTDPTWNWGPGTAAPADQGVVTFINVTNGGSGYTAVPTVDITEPGKTGATAKAALSTVVSAVAIVDPVGTPANKGLGYVSPIVIIDPPLSGIGATADATIDGTGAITGIVVTNGGSGYDPGTPPLVTIFDLNNDNYTPAVATATVVSTVSSISVLSGGSGYVNPTVTITPAGGDTTGGGAQASATVTDIKPLQTGDLWWPHVYMPAQNPYDVSGIAPMGRWAYGPYFYPATNNPFQPIPNPYYSPLCDPADDATPGSFGGFCQAPEIPSTPNPSWGAEAFMDTPLVNGTAYPYVDVDPKAYRLRILNAAHDRFMALSLFTAVDKTGYTNPTPAPFDFTGAATDLTEVAMIDASASGLAADGTCPGTWPADGRAGGVPACSTKGPDWIMIGNEGGFLPMPVVIPPQPITWNMNPSMFNVGNVNGGSLILGPAERADVIVDFSAYRGKTLILYNDGSAPWPALNPQYDFYTGNPDGTASGSAPSTAPGKGPNTRTIMQFRVADIAPAATYDTAPLITAFTSTYVPGPTPSGTKGVFQQAQDPIIVAQGNMNPTGDPVLYEAFLGSQDYSAYNKAYNKTFPATYPNWGIVPKINDKIISFKTLTDSNGTVAPTTQSIAMKNKSIHDEMGATFDDYGRMRAALGLEKSGGGGLQVNFVVQTYSSPATENLTANGVQVWKITHNGVDTHPIHFHLFDVQVLNRIGWDGFVRLPDPTELGWKETVRISPLEDTIVAIKPIAPTLPFGVPSSFRPLNPATEIGSTTEITQIDPVTGNAYATPLTNSWANFKWEYVWHCHILSHEENDMMRAMSLHVVEAVPAAPTWGSAVIVAGPPYHVDLTWNDKSATEYLFRLDRSVDGGAFTKLVDVPANTTTYSDLTATNLHIYRYTVTAVGAQGSATSGIITASPPPPGASTLTSPVAGATIATTTPSYTWTVGASEGATQYRLYIARQGAGVIPGGDQTFNAAAICTGTTAVDTCTVNTPPMPTLTNNTTYTWNVQGSNVGGAGLWAGARLFTVTTATVPGVPTLTSPVAGAVIASTTPSYTWTVGASAGATQYRIYLTQSGGGVIPGGDQTFNAAAICTGTTAGDTCTVNTPPMPTLTNNTTYSWNVRGINAAGNGAWAGSRSFTVTTATVPGVPTPTPPIGGIIVGSTTPSYTWTVGASAGATQYRIYLTRQGAGGVPGGDRTFNAAAICTGTTAVDTCTVNTPPMPTLTGNTTYFWNLRGINAAGSGAWAGAQQFKTP
ncbi:MAG: multicopper oxidase domain-containing protein [Nitrospirae bacterium]|nr:multicopper oxidase domain-containing protein [Nitrospirota bacterium]